ncbi:MAG: hypothetical protein EOP83_03500 [Verrucomicrobiaceae bacterium]|nr:MAG: hypothetical protein EOP83_03500 [Verrucomicrobiaceae bacterium]
MACTHYHDRTWRQWRHWFAKPPQNNGDNAVPWFPGADRAARDWMIEQAEAWFLTDEAQGLYWCETTMPKHATKHENGTLSCHSDDVGWTWIFTDVNTAFAFKMRFM